MNQAAHQERHHQDQNASTRRSRVEREFRSTGARSTKYQKRGYHTADGGKVVPELCVFIACKEDGGGKEDVTPPSFDVQQSQSLLVTVKLGFKGLERTVPRQPFRLSSQQSQSLLVMVKLGLPGLRSTVPPQNPKSQCPLVELGRHGPEQRVHPVPGLQQPQGLLAKLGLLESQSRAPRQTLISLCPLAKLDPLGHDM